MRPATRRAVRAAIAVGAAAVVILVVALVLGSAAGSRSAAQRSWRLPTAGAVLDYQIGGPYSPGADVRMVVRDWHVAPAAGRYDVCYVDAFETQAEATAWWRSHHADLLLRHDGAEVEDPGWAGQYLLDTSTAARRTAIAAIEEPWIDHCASAGYQAVELDNLDSWFRSDGALTTRDNLALAAQLVAHAHARGLAVAQKNGAVLKGEGRRVAHFDFAIAEACQVYSECSAYLDAYGDRVWEIEYTDEAGDPFQRACAVRGRRISIILRDRLVVPRGRPGYRYETCSSPGVAS